MIDKNLKCIFVHCQKCAGESIESAVFGRADRGCGGDQFRGSKEKHFSASQYISKYGSETWSEYFTFSFVRNPWDRVVSWIKFRDARFNRQSPLTPSRIKAELNSPLFIRNTYNNLLFSNRQELLVDFVGKVENIDSDFAYIQKKLQLNNVCLPRLNCTRHRHYSSYYDEEAVELVRTIYGPDIDYFNYRFEKYEH